MTTSALMPKRKKPIPIKKNHLRGLLPIRKAADNKSTAGRSLIVGGSRDFFGAAILAGTAAARIGSGYTTVLSPAKEYSFCKNPDLIFRRLNKKTNWKQVKLNAVGLGPGLGEIKYFAKIIQSLEKLKIENVVIDADGLNALAKMKSKKKLAKTWILTPHEGELARLIGRSSSYVKKNRISCVDEAQNKYGCLVLLKGAETLIKNHSATYVIKEGHPALAKSGTGDVLTGMIVGFLAQGLSPLNASLCGVYIHGLCSQYYVKSGRDPLSLLASDLVNYLPFALAKLRKDTKVK